MWDESDRAHPRPDSSRWKPTVRSWSFLGWRCRTGCGEHCFDCRVVRHSRPCRARSARCAPRALPGGASAYSCLSPPSVWIRCAQARVRAAQGRSLPPGPELDADEPAELPGQHVERPTFAAVDACVAGHRGLDEPGRVRELDRRLDDPGALLRCLQGGGRDGSHAPLPGTLGKRPEPHTPPLSHSDFADVLLWNGDLGGHSIERVDLGDEVAGLHVFADSLP